MYQEDAGRCCALAGDINNADKLLKWAAENRNIPDETLTRLDQEGETQILWKEIGFQISGSDLVRRMGPDSLSLRVWKKGN